MSKSRKVKFASHAAMLRELGRPVRVRYRRRLEQALTLWSQLSIRWKEWYCVPQYEATDEGVFNNRGHFEPPRKVKTKDAERVQLELPPPIESMGRNTLDIVISKAWLEQTKFECKVDLPLPMNAAVQNLIWRCWPTRGHGAGSARGAAPPG